MPNITVYGLRVPGGSIRYVGQTTKDVHERLGRHQKTARFGSNYPVHRWMRKHVDVELIVLVDDAVWDVDEIAQIEKLRLDGLVLLNCNAGGFGMRDPSPETRAKMSAAKIGRPASEETRQRMSAALKGRSRNNGHLGMKRSEATKQKMRGANNSAAKITLKTARRIKNMSKNTNSLRISRSLDLPYGLVYAVVSGRSWAHA